MSGDYFFPDRRGVSTTLSYALNLAIAGILVSGLLFAAGSTVQDQRQIAVREELQVIGQRIASAVQESDRMVQVGSDPQLRMTVLAPRSVAGLQYTIEFDAGAGVIILETENPDITVRVSVVTDTPLQDSEARGGNIFIVYESGSGLRVGVA
jgi:hypothetical protein